MRTNVAGYMIIALLLVVGASCTTSNVTKTSTAVSRLRKPIPRDPSSDDTKTSRTSSPQETTIAGDPSSNVTKTPTASSPQENTIPTDPRLIGYWRTAPSSSVAHFANVDPMDSVILYFRSDAILDVQIESVKYMRGTYAVVSTGRMKIKLYHWNADEEFAYSLSEGQLTLTSNRGKSVYKKLSDAH